MALRACSFSHRLHLLLPALIWNPLAQNAIYSPLSPPCTLKILSPSIYIERASYQSLADLSYTDFGTRSHLHRLLECLLHLERFIRSTTYPGPARYHTTKTWLAGRRTDHESEQHFLHHAISCILVFVAPVTRCLEAITGAMSR